MAWAYFGTWHFGTKQFGADISSQGLFGMRTFRHENILAWVYFSTIDVSTQGCYGTMQSNIDILAQVPLCENVPVWHECPCAKMSLCWNILVSKCSSAVTSPCLIVHGAEKYPCRNVLVPRCPCEEKSQWWNVHAIMSLSEMLGNWVYYVLITDAKNFYLCYL